MHPTYEPYFTTTEKPEPKTPCSLMRPGPRLAVQAGVAVLFSGLVAVVVWLFVYPMGERLLDVPPQSIMQPGELVTLNYDYRIDRSTVIPGGTRHVVIRDSGQGRDDRWIIDRLVSVKELGTGEIRSFPRLVLTPVK